MTDEEWLDIVKDRPTMLLKVPDKFITQEMCDLAVKKDHELFRYVPENLRTSEMCWEVVKKNYYQIWLVPENLKTSEMFLFAIKKDINDELFIYVPEHLITPEICVSAVERNGLTIKYVPEKLKTKELCTKALEQLNEFGREDLEEIERYKAEERFVCRLRLGVLDLENLEELNTFFSHVPVKLRDSEMYLSFFKLCHNIGYVQGFIEGHSIGADEDNY